MLAKVPRNVRAAGRNGANAPIPREFPPQMLQGSPLGAGGPTMGRKARIAIAAALLTALAGAGWWFGSPWWTLWRMREAAEAGDARALESYIDFPAVRASTKAQLGPRLGSLGAALARPAVDALVSPAALRLALAKPRKRRAEAGELELIRAGASEFRLHRPDATGGRGDLVFRRRGLGWRLTEVRIAPD
jgi:hypothetical protein